MAKESKSEALEAWRAAEEKYRRVIEAYVDANNSAKIDKDAAVTIARARAKADKRLETCLHRLLD